jgi:hypothetical protein
MKGTLKPPEIPEKDQSPLVEQLRHLLNIKASSSSSSKTKSYGLKINHPADY